MDIERATATPRGPVSVQVDARGLTVIQDKPRTSGGQDEGMMASELVLAGLLACQHSTFVKVAAKRGVEAAIERLDGEIHFGEAGNISEFRVHYLLHAPLALTDKQILQVCRLTDRACTISKVLAVPVNLSYERVATPA